MFWGSRDCDLTDFGAVLSSMRAVAPDAVIQAAALSGGIGLTTRHPATVFRKNLLMDINVLEAARELNIGKVVLSLSVGMYPTAAPLPLREESMHDGLPHESAASYAFAKRMVDPLLRSYRREYGMSVIGLVPNGIFGEHDHFNAEEGTMLASLIQRFHAHRNEGGPITVWGDGSPLREYTYAPDMARAYLWGLEHYDEPQVLNVGSTEEHSIRETAFMIADSLAINRDRIVFDTTKPSGIARRGTDNSKFLSASGFAYTPFAEALSRTVLWYSKTVQEAPQELRTASKITGRK